MLHAVKAVHSSHDEDFECEVSDDKCVTVLTLPSSLKYSLILC